MASEKTGLDVLRAQSLVDCDTLDEDGIPLSISILLLMCRLERY